MDFEEKAKPEGRKNWLKEECEALGIAYLGELKPGSCLVPGLY